MKKIAFFNLFRLDEGVSWVWIAKWSENSYLSVRLQPRGRGSRGMSEPVFLTNNAKRFFNIMIIKLEYMQRIS